jgi:hypothetical protein
VIIIVVSLNILIALFGFYVAWRLWCLKTSLGQVANALLKWEENARHSLNPTQTPAVILQGKDTTVGLRRQYAQLQLQLNRLRHLMMLLSFLPVASRWARRLDQRRYPKP